jgi:Zn-dependent M28 family amino/carboxypeptidase
MDQSAYLRQVVQVLARDIGVRSFRQHEKLKRTADYIAGEFKSFNYAATRQAFSYQGNQYDNVIAELIGTERPEKLLIIGAHYDTVGTTPGADDNASGIAGLLGIARGLSAARLKKTVRFVAFPLEEPPTHRSRNMGSYHYAESLYNGQQQVEGMICLEMIGYFVDKKNSQQYPFPFMNLKFPNTGNFISLVGNTRSKDFTEMIATEFRKAADLPVQTLNAPAIVIGIDFSDHWAFGKFGYKALMVTDTAFYRNPHYHAPTDLPDTLDYERMGRVVEGLVAAVRAWGMGGDEI